MEVTRFVKKKVSVGFSPPVALGEKIDGKYQVLSQIGTSSGQSDIYLCAYKGKKQVVKLYRHDAVLDEQMMVKLSHLNLKHVVPVLALGRYKGRRYEVIPYYPNGDLSRVEKLGYETLKSFVIPVLNEALYQIHTQDIVHMDLKPSNIFLDAEENLYLGDFGISSSLGQDAVHVTGAKGTYGYRPPESYSEASIKSRQFDYYSLGMTLVDLWLGESPYKGMNAFQIMVDTMEGDLQIPEDMPDDLVLLIRGLTAYDKRSRLAYESVKAWCDGYDISRHVDMVYKGFRQSEKGEVLLLDRRIKGLRDLSLMATESEENWNEIIRSCDAGVLDALFKSASEDDLMILIDERTGGLDSQKFARLLYRISGGRFIGWKNMRFNSMEDFAKSLQGSLPKIPVYFKEMHESGFIRFLLNQSVKKRQLHVEMEERLLDLEHEVLCFRVAYLFSDSKTFNYRGRKIRTFAELTQMLKETEGPLAVEISNLMGSAYFLNWVESFKAETGDDHA